MRIACMLGFMASLACIGLCAHLLFFNPYTDAPMGTGTILVILLMLALPACLGAVASVIRSRVLMTIVFCWSLPYGLYLAFAPVPSIYNLFGIVLLLYLTAAVGIKKRYGTHSRSSSSW